MGEYLIHYGVGHDKGGHSGRYPWGSGDTPNQRSKTFYDNVNELRRDGMTDKEIWTLFNMSSTEFRKRYSLAKDEYNANVRALNQDLMDQGITNRSERARRLGVPESTLRSMENQISIERSKITKSTADMLKSNIEEKRFIDVGDGVASSLGITNNRLGNAVQSLKDEGYVLHDIYVDQATNPGKKTRVQVLCEPGTEKKYLYDHLNEIGVVNEHFDEPNGLTKRGIRPPKSFPSERLEVVYAEDGGANKDGLIELRRGAEGLDMGNSNYAQVRIAVDGKRYLKGMAVYSDDLPDGIDIRFNTNKSNTGNKLEALKEMKKDPDNPFGSTIKPGGQKGYLNIVQEQGQWQEWSKTLSSQFLSKQSVVLARQQLSFSKQEREKELKDILSLSNPTVKKHELEEFAEKCDTAAVHLKAASLPGQSNSVILPVNSLKPTEIYAPNYPNGTNVVLVRHPHGGTFELPELKVNNRNAEAKKLIGISNDAVGIHHSVAAQLSGADFDGDTVIVIPNNSKKVKTRPPFQALQEFDPKVYAFPEGTPEKKFITPTGKQKEMGIASNLITDMTLRGAPDKDLIRAVKYSMVVIDSEKHKLDYKQAKKDYGITELKKKYQQKISDDGEEKYGGASTLISRAKSEKRVEERRQVVRINPETGEKIYLPTGRTYVDKKGNVVKKTIPSTQMREAKDAFSLVSSENNGTGTSMERVYAQYANNMKSMANQARKAAYHVKESPKDPAMAKKYSAEVDSLKSKLADAKAWSPKERNAQIYANWAYKQAKLDNPNMTDDDKKKYKEQALITGRARLGGKKPKVDFTDREWEAIQNNAIAKTTLSELLRYADSDKVRERALPKSHKVMDSGKIAIAKARLKAGFSYEEVARILGVSKSSVQRAINEN